MTTAARIVFDPAAPWPVLAGVAGLLLVVLGVYVWRRGGAPVSRAAGLALILVALAQPLVVSERREPARDIAALIIDQSESLALAGRLEAARAAGETLARKIAEAEGVDVRIREVRGSPDGTAIVGALEDALRDAPREQIAGAFLVTDGQASDPPPDPRRLRALGPVHTLIVGDPERGQRRLELLSAPGFGIVGQPATIEARVEDTQAGVSVPVTVSIDGAVVAHVSAVAGKTFSVQVTPPQRGPNMVVIEAAPGSDEITLANNRAAFELMGVRDRLRVLLVTGEPHAGARVWRNLLKSDPGVDLVHFTILRPPEKQDYTPQEELALITFPTRELFVEKLDGFDLIIFDRYRRRGSIMSPSYFENIAQRVEKGGALLVVAGPHDTGFDSLFQTPLAAILPSQPTGRLVTQAYRPMLTPLGERHPVTRGLPDPTRWGRWTRQIDAVAGSGQTVLSGENGRPLLVLGRAGQGRVAQLWSDQAWLWSRGYDGGGPNAELLRRLAHWLMQEPELEDERLSLEATPRGLRAERTTLEASPEPVRIIGPAGETAPAWKAVGPGLFRTEIETDAQGLFEAQSGDLRAFAARGPLNPREASEVNATPDKLEPLSRATGGGVFLTGETAADLPKVRRVDASARAAGQGWAGLRRRGAYTVRASETKPFGEGWMWAAAAASLLFLSWRREGR